MVAALIAALVMAPAAVLPHAHGWRGGTGRIANESCPRCIQVDSWASTVRYRDAPNDFPHKTMAALGANDVIIQVIRSWQPSAPRWMHQRHPLRIIRSQIHSNFEGNTTHGRVSLWGTGTWLNGSSVTVYIYFGSPHPTAATVARAQHELATARFPPWRVTD